MGDTIGIGLKIRYNFILKLSPKFVVNLLLLYPHVSLSWKITVLEGLVAYDIHVKLT